MKPCGACPFRKAALPGWLGTFEDGEAIAVVARSEYPFSCHKKTGDKTSMFDVEEPQCVGRLLYASKCAKQFREPILEKLRLQAVADNPEFKEEILGRFEFEAHHRNSIMDADSDMKPTGTC